MKIITIIAGYKTLLLSRQKFSIDTFWNVLSVLILAISGILTNILIGNTYSAEGLGIFNQALAIYLLLTIVFVFGTNYSVLKYSAEHKDNKNELGKIVSSALIMILIFSLIFASLSYLLIHIGEKVIKYKELMSILKLIIIGPVFFALNKILLGFLNGIRKMRAYAFFQSIKWIFILCFILISIILKKSLSFSILAIPFTDFILFILLLTYSTRFFSIKIKGDKKWFKKHFKFAKTTVLTNSINELNEKVDILIVSLFLSNYYVGIYSFASTIAKGLLMFPTVIQLNFNPIISNLWARKKKTMLTNYIVKLKKNLLLAIVPMILISIIVYPFFTYFFMKDVSFIKSIPVFYILLVGIGIFSLFKWGMDFLLMTGHPEKQLVLISLSLVFNIIANCILTYFMGIIGTAIATSLFYLFMLYLLNLFNKNKLNIKLL